MLRRQLLLLAASGLLVSGCGGGGGGKAKVVTPPPPPIPRVSEGFFAAKPAQITPAVVARGPAKRFRGAEWKGMDTVMVGTLGAIVGAGDYESLAAQMQKSTRNGLFRVPTTVRDSLAGLTHPELFARRWAATQAMTRDLVSSNELRPLLSLLRRLAREAQADRTQLWVWSAS